MYLRTFIALSFLVLLSPARADEHCGHDARGISQDTYDLVLLAEKLGVNVENVDTDALPFKSLAWRDCLNKARLFFDDRNDLAVAIVACGARHPSSLQCGESACGAWIGIIGLNTAEVGYHDLIKETRTIPLVLPPDDRERQWGFAVACDDEEPCTVSYALYTPREDRGQVTNDHPALERTITTAPGGVVRPFGFDPGDYLGTYRLVVGLDGREICDATVQVVDPSNAGTDTQTSE